VAFNKKRRNKVKAVVFHGIGDIKIEDVPEPKVMDPLDAIVKITASAICGTDLHMIRGTMTGMEDGTILGHEGVGVVQEVGANVRNIKRGDRVIIPSTIACGYCSYCRAGYFSQCDNANPNGKQAGTAFFGGPKETGPFNGLQAEYARVPFANVGLVKIPDNVNDDEAILLSDIFPTGYFGAKLAEIKSGDTVAVFGCGPVGQFAIISAFLQGAARVIAVDHVASRLELAQKNGAEIINQPTPALAHHERRSRQVLLELLVETCEEYEREVEGDCELYQVIALDAKGIWPRSAPAAGFAGKRFFA
jgi:threonine dehydrogenase-like Zn-dependent dehydrogenase